VWTEASLLDSVMTAIGGVRPLHLLRQVEVESRRVDAIAILGDRRIAIEAKVSRADFGRESDEKRAPSWRATHGCVYLCPPGLIEADDLPSGWGLWWALSPTRIRVVEDPRWHEPDLPALDALSTSLARRTAALEDRVRVAEAHLDPTAALVAAGDEAQRLSGLLATRDAAVARERARAEDAAEQVLAALGPQRCADCDEVVTYTRTGAWRHPDAEREARCERSRAEQERQRRARATGAEYLSVKAPRVMPAGVSAPC
jgi:hypothetical protein